MQFKNNKSVLAMAIVAGLLTSCSGDDGRDGSDGANGADGSDGANGSNSLLVQTQLATGNSRCFNSGVRIDSGIDTDGDGSLGSTEITGTSYVCSPAAANQSENFVRIASFPVCSQIDAACNNDTQTSSEIVAASTDGMVLVYTDSPAEQLGFVDIADPANPVAAGTLALAGEPTSVAVKDNYALVAVNTSADFVNVSGQLAIVDLTSKTIVETIDLGGQPDSVAVSPDGNYAAVVIENERDEDLGDGAPPQLPAGTLIIVNTSGTPDAWTTSTVDFTGIADLYPGDPEPEFVDINSNNIAVVTLQENNHIALVNLTDGSIVDHFSAGALDLDRIDATEDDMIVQNQSLSQVKREPDGVAWINTEYFATADEGDLDGGSRSFTVFNTAGDVVWSSGASLDHIAARVGHYPEGRSENKGNEPENVELGIYGENRYLFINSERSSLVFVYDVADPAKPVFKQVLPAALGPEGALAIPLRNLLVTASEEDAREDGFRSVVNIYSYNARAARYPTIQSVNRSDGTPIPWSALSGLAADPLQDNLVYAVEDSAYRQSRIFTIDVDTRPASLISETRIRDANNVLAALAAADLADATVDDDDVTRVGVFDEADLALMINADKTVNLDPEGVAKASDGGFWIASEGAGTVGDENRPVNSLNLVLKTDANGVIENVVTLPDALNDAQLRFGFEGVAEYNGSVYVAFQRVWPGDTNVRIGIYDIAGESWSFLFYPLDAPESQNGGWVGLSDLTSLGEGKFLVIERDNQGGPDAAIKRLYTFDVTGLAADTVVTKTLIRDLTADLAGPGGLIPEKIEGLTALANGDVLIVNDNDGVDDNSGETQFLNLGNIL